MFTGLWPGFDAAEVPIGSVTNGVHAPAWVASEILELAAAPDGRAGRLPADDRYPADGPAWELIAAAGAERIWAIRRLLRARLVAEARRRLRASWQQRGASEAELTWINEALDENVLTIGFARRVPSYKRLTLMLCDPERLTALLLDPDRPVQIVIAGKAHPADDGGKLLIQQMVRFTDDPRVRHRIVFLPDYDMALGRALVEGCDVWLNNPLRPLEACGTSGMKSALNGGLNLSVRDGWWDEWYDGANGWAIPSADGLAEAGRRDEVEAAALYDLIGQSVAPLFYESAGGRAPRRWLEMVAHTLRTLGPKAQATRMVREYVTSLYLPAALSSRALTGPGPVKGEAGAAEVGAAEVAGEAGAAEVAGTRAAAGAGFAGARQLAAWEDRVIKAWPAIRIEHVEAEEGEQRPGARLAVRAMVALGDLTPADVTVQVVYGRAGDEDEITDPACAELALEGLPGSSPVARYVGQVELGGPGPFGYTVRVLPRHPLLATPAELGLIVVPDAPAGMTNGDLR
jgi:starch phosphorylase